WRWGEDLAPATDARFSLVYTIAILLASLLMTFGIDPLKLTIYTMALNATLVPIVAIPFLMLMNDRRQLRDHANGVAGNSAVAVIVIVSVVLFVVSIPLLAVG